MFISVLLWSVIYSGSCTGSQVTKCAPNGLSLEGIQEGYSDRTPGGIRGKQGFDGEELDIRDVIRSIKSIHCFWSFYKHNLICFDTVVVGLFQ